MASESIADHDGEFFSFPGKTKSCVWDFFRFRKVWEGPANKSNLDMTTVVCKLCKKTYANKGSVFAFPTHITFSEIESEILPNIEQSLTITGM